MVQVIDHISSCRTIHTVIFVTRPRGEQQVLKKKTILFLYTELAGYFLACVDALVKTHNCEVHIVRWPVNKEAPFHFSEGSGVHFYERGAYDDAALVAFTQNLKPDVVICSGWVDKGYLKAIKAFKKRVPTILTLDNHWRGDMKQRLASVASPLIIRNKFTHAWVPGEPQIMFARKLGFKDNELLQGFYSADHAHFDALYKKYHPAKAEQFPHRFLYIGRYLDFKGIFDMWNAFMKLKEMHENDWELYCLGTGDLWDQRVEHPAIQHFGFVQPEELEQYIAQTGVFILPSHKEPWAVTVHEFAAAGFPMICSNAVGAATRFVEEGKNGYIYPAADEAALLKAMQQIVAKSDAELSAMAEHSHTLSNHITPEKWAKTLMNVLN